MSEPLHQSGSIVLYCIVKFHQEANVVGRFGRYAGQGLKLAGTEPRREA